jgi:hypothetical protein
MTKEQMAKLGEQCDALIAKIDAATASVSKRKQRFTLEHDDGADDDDNGTYQDVSNPSMDAADNTDEPDDDEVEYDDDDDGEEVHKASVNEYLRENSEADRPGHLKSSSHTSSSNMRHKFEALTEHVKNTEGVPKSYAMALARQRYPDVYADYVNGGRVAKRADDLIEAEIRKGFTPAMAAQRVANLYGYRGFDNEHVTFQKGCGIAFEDAAEDIYANTELDRCESLRKARRDNPRLWRAMQGR